MKKPKDKKETIEAKLDQIIRLLMELDNKTYYPTSSSGGGQGGYLCPVCREWVTGPHQCC